MPEAKLKSMMSLAMVALASIIACRSEPTPESELLVTVKGVGAATMLAT